MREDRENGNKHGKKDKNGENEWHTEGVEITSGTYQNLYTSEYLGFGLGRKLYFPPLERLGSFCGIISVVGLFISIVKRVSPCLSGGYCIGSFVVSMSVFVQNHHYDVGV